NDSPSARRPPAVVRTDSNGGRPVVCPILENLRSRLAARISSAILKSPQPFLECSRAMVPESSLNGLQPLNAGGFSGQKTVRRQSTVLGDGGGDPCEVRDLRHGRVGEAHHRS